MYEHIQISEADGITTITINRLDFGLKEYLNMAAETVEIEVNVKFNRK